MKTNKKEIFLSILIALSYALLLLDIVKYPGFTRTHFLIDAKIYSAIVITFLLFTGLKSKLLNFVFKINLGVLSLSSAIYILFSYLEGSHYQNYVLSKYHFHLGGLVFLVIFSFSIFFCSKINKIVPVTKKNIANVALVFLVVLTLLSNFGATFQKALEGDFYVSSHIFDSYDQKMYSQWGDFYNYMVFVKNNTPENANIVIPPQIAPWWTRSGNSLLVQYFLFPRKIIQYETVYIPDVESLPKGTYLMIAWGGWECEAKGCSGWPVETIKAEEVIFKDMNFGVGETSLDFVYDPLDTSKPFGLLKL